MAKQKRPRVVDRKLTEAERRALASAFCHAYTVALFLDLDPPTPLPAKLLDDPDVAAMLTKLERAETYAAVFGEVRELVQRMAARLCAGAHHAATYPSLN